MTGAVLAPAQSPSPNTGPHVLLVPTTAAATAALARTDARVIAGYQSFTLVEAEGADEERLRRAGAERRDDMLTVETAAGQIDPTSERTSLAAKEGPNRDEVLAVVQFIGPPKDAWLERLRETGVRIVTYQAENAYIVYARGSAVDRLAGLQGGDPAVRAVSVLTAKDKLEDRGSRTGQYAITTVKGPPGEDARDEAAQAGPPAGGVPMVVGALDTEFRALSQAEVARLAKEPGVVAIEANSAPELLDERAAQIMAGNLTSFAPTAPGYLGWLVDPGRIPDPGTFDFAIDVTDGGLDDGSNPPAHPDFRTLGTGASRVAYLSNYTGDSNARDCLGHGTNVASIAAGYNAMVGAPDYEDSSGYNHGLGAAPFAQVGTSKIFACDGTFSGAWTPAGLSSAAHLAGARISNNSWGTSGPANDRVWGEYTARSAAYDQLVRDARPGGGANAGNQQMVEIFAAGNDGEGNPGFPDEGFGTISAEGSAKNVITVGASEGVRASGTDGCGVPNGGANSARDIIDFSSRGPTDDGRLKPDVVAPGTHITGAAPQHPGYTGDGTCNQFLTGTTMYNVISGTSQAAPEVAGAAALIRDWYTRIQGAPPSPALTKALLVNTTTDLAGGLNGKGNTIAAGPNADQGWGRVNLGETFDSTAREFRDQRSANFLAATGESRVHSYSVQDPGKPVKVTVAWTDAPGPTSGNPVVNNLDLVVDAGGRTYKGNVFAGAYSRTGGTADPRNNVESVYLPAGTTGRVGVTVRGTAVVGNGVPGVGDQTDQDFALVVSNADELPPTPVLSGEAPMLSDAGPGGDDDGTLEPNESFTLDESIRNGGDGAATGLSGTMTGGGPLTITQPTSAYPNTPAGASTTNATQFAGDLATGATCGADVSATLAVTTDQGSQDIPVVLPTGFPGSASPQSKTHSPAIAIPDDSSAGVSSTLTIANPGRIKDLDVSISQITHGWVGDLTIELTGPDGTTVRLADHPGGPDNGGKNFVDTVFDDEAAVNISSGSAPYTGSFRPQNDELSRFDGKDKQGNWTLRVRDLFEGDTGTLSGWGTNTRAAVCARNPQTTITDGPVEGQFAESTSASFQFTATEQPGNPPFECRLDSQPFVACDSSGVQTYAGLSQGPHTFEVRAIDAQGDADPSPATRTWVVDTVPPAVRIDRPPNPVVDQTPTFTGAAGTAVGDLSTVTVRIEDSGGNVVQTRRPTASGGAWSATAAALADGNYILEVEQSDLAGHVGTDSVPFSLVADLMAPGVSITTPGAESSTTDTTPSLSGTAGEEIGDEGRVTVEVFSGSATTGTPVTLSVPVTSGAWSTEPPQPLALGIYTARATQRDSAGNSGEDTVTFSVVDGTAPAVTIESPADRSTVADSTPNIAGRAGTDARDSANVTVKLYPGTDTGAAPLQTLFAARDGSSGAWAVDPAALADGTYTVRAEQSDASGNTGTSAPSTFTVDTPDPPPPADEAPTFLLAPAEERLTDAIAGRLTAVAACASACQVNARLTVSPRATRSLGLGRGPTALGNGMRRLNGAGSAPVSLRLTKRARAALRRRDLTRATLRVTVTEGADKLMLSRTISLRRSAGLRRVVARGLRLWAVCSEQCPLSAKLSMSSRMARRLGMKPPGGRRMEVATGRANLAARSPGRLTVKVKRSAKKALARARRVRALLETVAGTAPGPRRTAVSSMTLRR